jgi:hypothetical protein
MDNNKNNNIYTSEDEIEKRRAVILRHNRTRSLCRIFAGFHRHITNPEIFVISISFIYLVSSLIWAIISEYSLPKIFNDLINEEYIFIAKIIITVLFSIFISWIYLIVCGRPLKARKREFQMLDSGLIGLTDNVFFISEKTNVFLITEIKFYSSKSLKDWENNKENLFHNLGLKPINNEPIKVKGKYVTLSGKKSIKNKKSEVKDKDYG